MKKLLTILLTATAFDNKAGWKLDENGKIEVKDGNPIWIEADGTERTLGAEAINNANADAKRARERYEKAEASLKAFEGIDPAKAKEAIETLGKIDQKTLIDAGKVDEVKAQITQQFTQQIAEKDKAYNDLQSRYDNAQISNFFASSDFLRDRIAVPADMFEATFRQNVKVEEGKLKFFDRAGNPLMSKAKIGEYARADEALELLVDAHPQKEVILKADTGNGSGSGGGGGNRGGGRTIKRSEFEQMPASRQAEIAAQMGKGEIKVVD